MSKTTIASLSSDIATEADAYAYLENLRWNGTPICPHCHSENVYLIAAKNGVSRKTRTGAMSERRVWKCRSEGWRKQFWVLTGTIFHGTKVSVRTLVLVFFDFMAAKNGMAAREVERKYGVCPRTAWFLLQRVRHAMAGGGLTASLRGTIVADETWIGGKLANRHKSVREMDRGFGYDPKKTDKTAVLSLINATTGEARSRIVPDVTGVTLRKVIAEQVDMAGSTLYTDSHGGYIQIGREFAEHQSVNHLQGEYVRGSVTTNRAEGFFSQLKRSIDGTHHWVSTEHLQKYVSEHDFRYSTCKMSEIARMERLAGRMEGRLTYKRLKTT